MPVIDLKLSGKEDPQLAGDLCKSIHLLTQTILNKRPEVTALTVTFVPKHLWFINQESLADLNQNSFHLIIKISDSTNLKLDKSRFIRAVHEVLGERLENLHPVSYTAIQEMKADAYGYEGKTIEFKLISNQISSNVSS